jgi:arylsulfatase A-like enzyme
MAFNTPFKMWKRYEFNGGTADPCIISWPSAIPEGRGELRHQYHHAIDIVPTVLDVLGVSAPQVIKGHVQSRFDGVSMRYSVTDAPRWDRSWAVSWGKVCRWSSQIVPGR